MGLTITHGRRAVLRPNLHLWWRHLWLLLHTITKLQNTTSQLLLHCTIKNRSLRLRTLTSMRRWLSTLELQLLPLNITARLPPLLSTSLLFSTLVHPQGLRFDSITPTLAHKLSSYPSTTHGNIIIFIITHYYYYSFILS
jgi:hypothetical protein